MATPRPATKPSPWLSGLRPMRRRALWPRPRPGSPAETTLWPTLAREQQDLARQSEASGQAPARRSGQGRQRRRRRGARRAGQDRGAAERNRSAACQKEHPDYVALVNPEPLTVAQTQALLAPDEAFVQFLDVAARPHSPIPETAFAFVITRTRGAVDRTAAGRQGAGRPGRPPCAAGWTRAPGRSASSRCAQLLGKAAPGDDLPPFDLARAHGLYRDLFGQAEDVIKDKRLLIAPSGALTQLPFQVLVTEAPDASAKGAGRLRQGPLARRAQRHLGAAVGGEPALAAHGQAGLGQRSVSGLRQSAAQRRRRRPQRLEQAGLRARPRRPRARSAPPAAPRLRR